MMMFTNSELEMLIEIREKYKVEDCRLDFFIEKLIGFREKNRRDSRESQRKKRLTNRT